MYTYDQKSNQLDQLDQLDRETLKENANCGSFLKSTCLSASLLFASLRPVRGPKGLCRFSGC